MKGFSIARLVGAAALLLIGLAPALGEPAATDWSGRGDPATGPFAAGYKVWLENCSACHDGGIQRLLKKGPHGSPARRRTSKPFITPVMAAHEPRPQGERDRPP